MNIIQDISEKEYKALPD